MSLMGALPTLSEIVAILFDPEVIIVLLYQSDCNTCENIAIYFWVTC
jgi:hypothetical protein